MTQVPPGWTVTTLGQVARWGSGGTPKAGDGRFYGGQVPWAVIGDLNDGVVRSTAQRITELGLAESSAKLVPEGAVLVAMYGSIGKLGIAGMEMATNQAIAFAVPDGEVLDRDYLFHYLLAQRHDLGRAGKGATQQNIGQGVLKAWPICFPGLQEQRRIVDLLEDHLSRLDAAAVSLDHAEYSLMGLREKVVRDAITGARVTGERFRDVPSAEGVEDGDLASLPAGWQWLRLRDIAEVVGGVTKDSGRQSDPAFVEVPYMRVANVQRGRLVLDTVTNIRVAQSKADALRLIPGDVLMNEGGDRDKLGRGWIWEGQVAECIHQNHVFRARVLDDRLHPKLLSWAGNTIGGRWCERNGKQSVNLASISLNKIRLMPVPVPPLEAQRALVEYIEAALSGCDRLQASLDGHRRRLASLRRSLLAAAFSGRLNGHAEAIERSHV